MGFGQTLQVLELVYIYRDYPAGTPSLPVSLQQGGKSRADLWAFAALVAVDYAVDQNNNACDTGACHQRATMSDCRVTLPRAFIFKTGRRDCGGNGVLPYAAQKDESHPDPKTNGAGTIKFFKDN